MQRGWACEGGIYTLFDVHADSCQGQLGLLGFMRAWMGVIIKDIIITIVRNRYVHACKYQPHSQPCDEGEVCCANFFFSSSTFWAHQLFNYLFLDAPGVYVRRATFAWRSVIYTPNFDSRRSLTLLGSLCMLVIIIIIITNTIICRFSCLLARCKSTGLEILILGGESTGSPH